MSNAREDADASEKYRNYLAEYSNDRAIALQKLQSIIGDERYYNFVDWITAQYLISVTPDWIIDPDSK